jgi:ABC-type sugar transport system permease subunit
LEQLPVAVASPRRGFFSGLRGLAGLGTWSRLSPLARREALQGLLFISPWIIGFLAFTLLPMIATFAFTFLNVTLRQEEPIRFVGLDNYTTLARDQQVWSSLLVTLKFAAFWLPVSIIVPLAIALGLNSIYVRGASIMRTLFFAPYVVPFVAGCLIWNQMLGSGGWFNEGLRFLGWENPPDWLYNETWIYPGFVLIGIWGIGAAVIINLAGLRGIPSELYDAAKIDGAGSWARLRNVTIPMISPVLFYSLILGVVEVFQYFLVPLVLKNGTGEPGGSTMFFNLNIFQTFFTFQAMSYGATMAWLLFVITLVVTVVLFRLSRRYVFYAGER